MNKTRRNSYYAIQQKIAMLVEDMIQLASEEREEYDALSERGQESEQGEAINIAATALEDCADSLQAAYDYLDEVED